MVLLSACAGNAGKPATQSQPERKSITVADINWLQGRWESATPEGTIFEEWTTAGTNELAGIGGFVKGADTMISETIALKMQDTNLVYIPTVKGQNNDQPITFTLSEAAGDSFVFENPAHDFPQVICYKRMGDTAMEARISGRVNGKEMAEGFVLRKSR